MEKERGAKLIAILALVVGVVGLSVGFAAFTQTLSIETSESTVSVGGILDVRFLAENDKETTVTTVSGTPFGVTAEKTVTAKDATVNGTTISGLGATFSDKGQSVKYTFYVHNNSQYTGYLRGVSFEDYTGQSVNKYCKALTGTDQDLVDTSCNDISLTIDIAGETAIDTDKDSFTTPEIAADAIIPVTVTIAYNAGDNTADLPNGDFTINFGDIKLSYKSVPAVSE